MAENDLEGFQLLNWLLLSSPGSRMPFSPLHYLPLLVAPGLTFGKQSILYTVQGLLSVVSPPIAPSGTSGGSLRSHGAHQKLCLGDCVELGNHRYTVFLIS